MRTLARRIGPLGSLLLALATVPVMAGIESPPRSVAWGETLVRADGQRISGRLRGDAASGFAFMPNNATKPLRLEPGAMVILDGPGPDPTVGFPPFRVEMGLGQRISGRLGAVEGQAVRLLDSSAGGALTIARTGVSAVIQRPGEVLVLEEDFESIDGARWTRVGDPELVEQPRASGGHSLRIAAGGASLTCRLSEPLGSGRLDVAFHDDGTLSEGQQWFADLLFRGPAGPETIRAVLGWAEESLSVESPNGPALAVQRLARKSGWHRLSMRFGPAQTEIGVDGNDLAHGKGPDGPLVEIRLASFTTGNAAAPERLAGCFDDLRLVRFTEPLGGLEIDPNQDEVRMAWGDQLFGSITSADAERVRLTVDERQVTLPWSEVSGLYFRRVARQGAAIEGPLVRVDWRAASGGDPSDLDMVEGALMAVSEASITIATPFAGRLTLPRDRRRGMRVLGSGHRIVVDPTTHHLGDNISTSPPWLDPPQPEGGTLERSVELARVPPGAASLVLDVVQVAGVGEGLQFASLVKKGELLTNVTINGKHVDNLNRHITSKNETPERIRLPVPAGLLRPGRNVIRFDQVGIASDPNYLDDLGVLGIALEFEPGSSPTQRPEQP